MYPNMKTVATVCNEIYECLDGSDEDCGNTELSNIIFGATFGGVLLLYIGLKFARQIYRNCFKENIQKIPRKSFEELLKDLKDNHKDRAAFENINNYLLHTIYSEKIETSKNICKLYYSIEADVHNDEISEIFCCLHNNLDPIVIREIREIKFPSLRTRIFNRIEDQFRTKFITNLRNKFIEDSKLGQLIFTVQAFIKIESSALDIMKDLFLAALILKVVGGYEAIWQYPTNFSSIVTILAFSTVIVPLGMSSILLMIEDPWAICTFSMKRTIPRPVMTLICFLMSGIIPILLLNAFMAIKEEAMKTARSNGRSISQTFKKYRVAKCHFVRHLRIELGT